MCEQYYMVFRDNGIPVTIRRVKTIDIIFVFWVDNKLLFRVLVNCHYRSGSVNVDIVLCYRAVLLFSRAPWTYQLNWNWDWNVYAIQRWSTTSVFGYYCERPRRVWAHCCYTTIFQNKQRTTVRTGRVIYQTIFNFQSDCSAVFDFTGIYDCTWFEVARSNGPCCSIVLVPYRIYIYTIMDICPLLNTTIWCKNLHRNHC